MFFFCLYVDFVGPDCDIPCMDNQGRFVDPKDGTDDRFPIQPVFACVERHGNSYTAWFDYINENENNVYITVRGENTVVGFSSGEPPTKFEQGNISYAFSIG